MYLPGLIKMNERMRMRMNERTRMRMNELGLMNVNDLKENQVVYIFETE